MAFDVGARKPRPPAAAAASAAHPATSGGSVNGRRAIRQATPGRGIPRQLVARALSFTIHEARRLANGPLETTPGRPAVARWASFIRQPMGGARAPETIEQHSKRYSFVALKDSMSHLIDSLGAFFFYCFNARAARAAWAVSLVSSLLAAAAKFRGKTSAVETGVRGTHWPVRLDGDVRPIRSPVRLCGPLRPTGGR